MDGLTSDGLISDDLLHQIKAQVARQADLQSKQKFLIYHATLFTLARQRQLVSGFTGKGVLKITVPRRHTLIWLAGEAPYLVEMEWVPRQDGEPMPRLLMCALSLGKKEVHLTVAWQAFCAKTDRLLREALNRGATKADTFAQRFAFQFALQNLGVLLDARGATGAHMIVLRDAGDLLARQKAAVLVSRTFQLYLSVLVAHGLEDVDEPDAIEVQRANQRADKAAVARYNSKIDRRSAAAILPGVDWDEQCMLMLFAPGEGGVLLQTSVFSFAFLGEKLNDFRRGGTLRRPLLVDCGPTVRPGACWECGSGLASGKRRTCKGCRVATYCGRECRDKHAAQHETACRLIGPHKLPCAKRTC